MKLQHVLLPDWNRILQSMETPVYCKLNVDEDVTTFEVFFIAATCSSTGHSVIPPKMY